MLDPAVTRRFVESAWDDSIVPEFSEVADRVRDDLQRGRREQANEAFYEGLKQRYEIVVEEPAVTPVAEG